MKRSLSRIAALSLALGLATSTASFASADILVLGPSHLPHNPELVVYRELIKKKYSDCTLPALTQEKIKSIKQMFLNVFDVCYRGSESQLSSSEKFSQEEKEDALKGAAKIFVDLYDIICGNAIRSTPHRIYLAPDEKTKDEKTKDEKTKDEKTKDEKTKDEKTKNKKTKNKKTKDEETNIVNIYIQTENDPVTECVGKLITEKGKKAKLDIKVEDWMKLPTWNTPYVVVGSRQDVANFMSTIGALDTFPVGACYLDGARVDLLAELALSQLIPGKKSPEPSPSDLGIFIFFPNRYSLMGATSSANNPYLKNNALIKIEKESIEVVKEPMEIVKEKMEKNLTALGKELFAVKNLQIFEKQAWSTPDKSILEEKSRAFKDYMNVRQQVKSDTFWNKTDAVFEGSGPFYTLMHALWKVAKTPNVEPDYTPDEELLSLVKMLPVVNTPESTEESYGVEDIEVIKKRIQSLAEAYGLTNEAQDAAAFIVQTLQEKRMLDSSYNVGGLETYYAFLWPHLLGLGSISGIVSDVSLDPKQLLLSARTLKEKRWDSKLTTEEDEKKELKTQLNREMHKKRAQKKYNKH